MKDTPMERPGNVNEFSKFVETVIENTYLNGVHLRIDGAIKMSNMWNIKKDKSSKIL